MQFTYLLFQRFLFKSLTNNGQFYVDPSSFFYFKDGVDHGAVILLGDHPSYTYQIKGLLRHLLRQSDRAFWIDRIVNDLKLWFQFASQFLHVVLSHVVALTNDQIRSFGHGAIGKEVEKLLERLGNKFLFRSQGARHTCYQGNAFRDKWFSPGSGNGSAQTGKNIIRRIFPAKADQFQDGISSPERPQLIHRNILGNT